MSWSDHTCEECPSWDDVNGCWAGGPGKYPWSIACEMYGGEDLNDEPDFYEDGYDYELER